MNTHDIIVLDNVILVFKHDNLCVCFGFCKATSNYGLKPRNGLNIIFEMIVSFRAIGEH